MKNKKTTYGMNLAFLFFLLLFLSLDGAQAQEVKKLKGFLKKAAVEKTKKWAADTIFTEKYEVFIEQPLDHENPGAGTFLQRFFVCHRSVDRPVVFVTEGYGADYAGRPDYASELGKILEANEIVVEHRYFLKSKPEPTDWQFLTVANAAADHHRIIELMKGFYNENWVSTGISKGGQTALFHRALYPGDVTATVGYVCPLNFSDEDLRIYSFLENTGTHECRDRIFEFQEMVLQNREKSLEAFESLAKKRKLNYSVGIEEAFELMVLEYAFAFWQWGTMPCEDIPEFEDGHYEWIGSIDKVAGLDWVADEGIERVHPFFYQAMTEIGMYGYDLEPFGDLIVALDNGRFDFTCPTGYECSYNPEMMQKVDCFLRHEAENVMVIYGEWDPWSATAVQWSGNPGLVKIVKPDGSHRTRIMNLPPEKQKEAIEKIKEWMNQ
jgi:hypothetical protein